MAVPDLAARRVNEFLLPGDERAGGEFGQAVFPGAQNAGARWQAGRGRARGVAGGDQIREPSISLGQFPNPQLISMR